MLGRVEIESNDSFELVCELRIVADLEAVYAMRLEAVGPPYAPDRGVRYAHRAGHRAARPVRGVGRAALRGLLDHLGDHCGGNRRCPSGPRSILHQARNAQLEKAIAPSGNGARSRLHLSRNLFVLKPVGGQQHDPAAQCNSNWSRTTTSLLLQLPSNLRFQHNRLRYTHIEVSPS